MAKIWHAPSRVYDNIYHVAKDSADDVLGLVQKKLKKRSVHPYATGALAASYRIEVESVSPDGVSQYIRSDSIYASVIEEGAWSGGSKGPHVSRRGNKLPGGGYNAKARYEVRNAVERQFGRYMTKKLKASL